MWICAPRSKRGSHMQLGKPELLRAYRTMKTIREFEERLHVEFATGEIPGFVHLYAGEEAIAAGICMQLDERDKITSTHRGHGHCLASNGAASSRQEDRPQPPH